MLVLTPGPRLQTRAKNLSLTEAGRALAEKTVAQVIRAEKCSHACRMGLERARQQTWPCGQRYLQFLREEFTQLKESTDRHKTENV